MKGKDKLWNWFGGSRSSFLVIPRSFMQEMPDEWQLKMSDLLDEYDSTIDQSKLEIDETRVQAVSGGRLVKMPEWIVNYRRPDINHIRKMMKTGGGNENS